MSRYLVGTAVKKDGELFFENKEVFWGEDSTEALNKYSEKKYKNKTEKNGNVNAVLAQVDPALGFHTFYPEYVTIQDINNILDHSIEELYLKIQRKKS